jgi:hypothetical protein
MLATGLLVAGGAAVGGAGGPAVWAGTAASTVGKPAPATPTIHVWWRALCFTGDITGAEYDAQGRIVVSGTAANCGNIPGEFTVVPFWPEAPEGRAVANQLLVYHAGATREFRAVLTADATRAQGICLMGSPAGRMDCVTVAPGPDGTLTVAQPPADSPAWTKRAYLVQHLICDPNDPDGICGSCLEVTGRTGED